MTQVKTAPTLARSGRVEINGINDHAQAVLPFRDGKSGAKSWSEQVAQ